MRLQLFVALVTASLLTSAQAAINKPEPRITPRERAQGYREQRILAKPRADRLAEAEAAKTQLGLTTQQSFPRLHHIQILELGGHRSADEVINRLRASGHFEYVERDYLRKRRAIPLDPRFAAGELWHLRNTGQESGTAGADISAVAGWDIRSDASSVIVAVIDSGIRLTHEDLVDNLWKNSGEIAGNDIDDDKNGYIDDVHGINSLASPGSPQGGKPDDDAGHGTMVAGVLGARGNNQKGTAGIAWKVQIMALKFDDAEGSGSVSNEIECIDYAIAHGARIINISYGNYSYSQAEFDAVKRARDAGAIVIAAAGNESFSTDLLPNYPGNYALDNVLAVAATDRKDQLADFSNYGEGMVELAAPGVAILTTDHSADDAYRATDGTSFACPLVAGTLALLKVQFPADSYHGLINRLLRSVSPVPALSGKTSIGGRLNVAQALMATSNRPYNDDFSARRVLTATSLTLRGHLEGATAETAEPRHADVGTNGTLWWSWTAASAGDIAVDTAGSGFDTVVAVYTGTSLDALQPVAANDDAVGATTSRVIFSATAGTTYHVAIGGKAEASGALVVNLGYLPVNDTFANAEVLSSGALRLYGFNTGAGAEAGEPKAEAEAGSRSVWYRWRAPSTRYYSLSVFAYGFDAVAAVYRGLTLDALFPVAKASTYPQNEPAVFSATGGTTYYFQVDTMDGLTGAFQLALVDAIGFAGYYPVDSSPAVSTATNTVFSGDSYGLFLCLGLAPVNIEFREIDGTLDVQTPAIGADGSMYIGDQFGYLHAFAPDLSLRWKKDFGLTQVTSSPAIGADGAIYVHTDDGLLSGYFSDGTLKWQAPVPGASYSSPSIAEDETIYIGSEDQHLYAISPLNGAVKWKFKADGEIYSSPAIDGAGHVYFGTLNGRFYSVTATGVQRWVYTAGGAISSSAAIAADGTLYFGCYDKHVYALSASGSLVWKYATQDEIRGSSPAIASNGIIYIGSYDGSLHAISSGGQRTRIFPTGAYIRSSPVIHDRTLMFGSGDGRFYSAFISVNLADTPWPMHRQNVGRTGRRAMNTQPNILTAPVGASLAPGAATTLAVNANGADTLTFQWHLNGSPINGATHSIYTIPDAAATAAGTYTVEVTNSLGTVTSGPAIVGVQSPDKVFGAAKEVGTDILHPNKNIFDQVLLQGTATSVRADPGQVLRMSFADLQDDLVQVEFSGAGMLTLVLDSPTGPAIPVKYNQNVEYMRGHASIVVTGADETTYLSVFSIGRANAVNQSLFRDTVSYDGFADIAYVAIQSSNGKCGGMRSGNTRFSSAKGFTGLYAPGVNFQDRVFLHDIDASGSATPVLQIGSAVETRITGGDLLQSNARAVQVAGLTLLQFTNGSDSHGNIHNAKPNAARLEQNGVDVTAQLVAPST